MPYLHPSTHPPKILGVPESAHHGSVLTLRGSGSWLRTKKGTIAPPKGPDGNAPSIWSANRKTKPAGPSDDHRTAYEKDHDRLLFSTPVRRLADKTQVFPLERNDSVRTRLTHSHEVSNLARSLGTRLLRIRPDVFGDDPRSENAPVILAAIGLAHDLGNPPFGHQGEDAIGKWYSDNAHLFATFSHDKSKKEPNFVAVPIDQQTDFTKFEGNAQSLRLVCRLQNMIGPAGLDLTAATLAALMKYTVRSSQIAKSSAASKKHGYFVSETEFVDWIRKETGLAKQQRHPLTWLMEASDDIAYSVLDIEDAIKKGLVSPEDLLAHLRKRFPGEEALGGLMKRLTEAFQKADDLKFALSRVREIKVGYLRTLLIDKLLTAVISTYLADRDAILNHAQTKALLDCGSEESDLCECLKSFARSYAYQSQNVLELEHRGDIIIRSLMDDMWEAISDRREFLKLDSKRNSPKARFVYSLISDSYRWHFETENTDPVSIRYRELQLLSDMISGMTDGYAVDLYERIRRAVA